MTALLNRWSLLAIFTLCVAVYIRGLFGGFIFDDYANIVSNSLLQTVDGTLLHWFTASLSSDSGLLRRPVSMLTFALNYYWFGLNPVAFKVVNLAIHLLNGWLIYQLSRRLLPRLGPQAKGSAAACAPVLLVTSLWLLHPLNVSDVVYVVQRMNELSSLFILLGLLCYVEGRLRMLRGEPGLFIAIGGLLMFGLLAVLSKENGALVTAYAWVVEASCLRFQAGTPRARASIKALFICTVALPCVVFIGFVALHPAWLFHGYAVREFTLAQRLLTEPRILWHYLLWIFVPWPAWMSLYHDDIPLSSGLLTPPTTLLAILAWTAVMALAWQRRQRTPALGFAIAWFLVGHSMESTLLPLEITFEHRNYLPMLGLLLGTVSALGPLAQRLRAPIVYAACALVLATLSALTGLRAYDWGDNFRLAYATAANHPDSPRSLYELGRAIVYEEEAKGQAKRGQIKSRLYFQKAMALNSRYIFPSAALALTYADEPGVPPAIVADLERRLRTTLMFHSVFLSVLEAITNGRLTLTPDDVDKLVEAAMDNPSTTSSVKAQILNDYGRYQFQVMQNHQVAVSLILAAAEQDPGNPLFQVNVTKLALALDQPDIAAEHLQKARELDVTDLYRSDIDRLAQQIAQH